MNKRTDEQKEWTDREIKRQENVGTDKETRYEQTHRFTK